MHALNRRPLTLRADQICQPKDLLSKIPVENFGQLHTILQKHSIRPDAFRPVNPTDDRVIPSNCFFPRAIKFAHSPGSTEYCTKKSRLHQLLDRGNNTQRSTGQRLATTHLPTTQNPKFKNPRAPSPFGIRDPKATSKTTCSHSLPLSPTPSPQPPPSLVFTHSSIYHKKVYGRTSPRTSPGRMCLPETRHSIPAPSP